MAKVRGTRFAWQTAVAAPVGEYVFNNCLRDIIPDKAFKVHGYTLYINNGTAILAEVQLLKNIAAPPGPVAGAVAVIAHGLMDEWAHVGVISEQYNTEFAEPLDFDKDDSLNIFFHHGTQGAAATCVFELMLRWSEK